MIGKTLAHYEVIGLVGKGGMGEVYRAHDTKLDREVALKILPQEFSRDPERGARFEREARVLASLQHPNIASIYGFEHTEGVRFLTMELAEGEDLAERLDRGPLPIEDVLRIADQLATGIEAAHQKNIIHRDLKPANIKVDASGDVKILDFGLARAYTGDPEEGEVLANSPTITAAMTQAGVILGTAAYMSPEQAKGKSVDQRSDIWSYGVVVFEMLTGRKLFAGETVSETMAEVMKSEINWDALPASTPTWMVALLRRCLDRDPRTRLQSVGEARIAIELGDDGATGRTMQAPATRSTRLPWIAFAATLLALAGVMTWTALRTGPVAPLVRSTLLPPDESYFAAGSPFTVSPDGQRIAFVASSNLVDAPNPVGTSSLWVRDLSESNAREIAGTNGAQYPFWSHDGRMLGFFAKGKLNKVDLEGGPVLSLCDTQQGRGGTWNEDGTILFQRNWSEGIMRIQSGGGSPESVTSLNQDRFDVAHRWPQFLPDGQRFLFFVVSTTSVNSSEYSGIYVGSLGSDETHMLLRTESRALYSQGHLLYRVGTTLMARPMDESSLQFQGDALPVATDIPGGGISWGGAHFGVSAGILMHLRGAGATNSVLVWRDWQGNKLGTVGDEANYSEPALSHDGRQLAVSEGASSGDIWIYDLDRDTRTRFTFDPAEDSSPLWSPRDDRIVFSSARQTVGEIYERPVSGNGSAKMLYATNTNITLNDWSLDGRWIFFSSLSLGKDVWDIMAYDTDEEVAVPVVTGPFSQKASALSPDGKWLAFASDESGQFEVYLQPFPEGEGRWMISTSGGDHPKWTESGSKLIFQDNERNLHSVEVTEGHPLSFTNPKRLLLADTKLDTGINFDVPQGGDRILINENLQTARNNQGASLIQNWTRILDR